MKNLDVLIVRLLPFFLFIGMGFRIIRCWYGIDEYPYNLFHSNSAIFATSLFLISLANKRYHCIWNRAMYILLIVVPIFNYMDALWLNTDIYIYLYIVTSMYFISAFTTAYLAIRHFHKVRNLKRRKS